MRSERRTVGSVVTDLDGVLDVLELLNGDDGAEDLLLDNLHVLGHISEDSGLDEVALIAVALATNGNGGTSLLAVVDVLHDAIELELGDLGTLEGVLLEGVAHLVLGATLLQASDELVVDTLLNQKTGTGAAALTVVVEDTEVGPGDGVVNVSVVEDDVGGLATQLESHLLQVTLGSGLHDGAANQGRTSEGNLVNVHVAGDGGTGHTTETGDDVDDTSGDARLEHQLSGIEGRQGSLFCRLEDDGVTGGQSGADLPRPHEEREVPGDDLTANTNGLVAGVGEGLVVGVNGLTVDLVGPATIVAQALGSGANIPLGHGDRLAVVQGLDGGQDVSIALEQVSQLGQEAAALVRSDVTPGALEGLAGSRNGNVDILLRSFVNGNNRLLVGGVDGLEGLAFDTLDPLVVDEPDRKADS